MSVQIIAALRPQKQLRGNTFLIATELAHRMNPQGVGRVAYQFLAWKAHCCRKTAITQVTKLIALGLFRKTVIPTKTGYPWNLYVYIGPRVQSAFPPVTTHSVKVSLTLPTPEREKDTSVAEDLARQKRWLPNMLPGTDRWQAVCEDIARLEALLTGGTHAATS